MSAETEYLIVSYRGENFEINVKVTNTISFDQLRTEVFRNVQQPNQDVIMKYHHHGQKSYNTLQSDFNVERMFKYFQSELLHDKSFKCVIFCENNGPFSFIQSELERHHYCLGNCFYPSSNTGCWIFRLKNDPSKALKVYTRDEGTFNNTLLYKELNTTLMFDHENILKVNKFFFLVRKNSFENSEQIFVCYEMDFYEEGSLQGLIDQKEKLSEDSLLDIFLQAAKAVECIQSESVVHRDLRPANILISEKRVTGGEVFYRIKVADFELATFLNSCSIKSIKGSNIYAPEVVTNGYSLESDVYSLAYLIYNLGTLKREYKESLLRSENWSIEMINLISQMMDPEPSKRPNISQVIQTIEICIQARKKFQDKQMATLLIAIDFGSARSGYGICYDCSAEFKEEYVRNNIKINEHWEGTSTTEYKNVTEILYENDTPIAWGFKARKKYQELLSENPSKQYYLIDNIKMSIMKVSERDVGEIYNIELRQSDSQTNSDENTIKQRVKSFEKELEKLSESPVKKNVSKQVVEKVANLFRKKDPPMSPITPTEISQTSYVLPVKENGKIYLECRKKKFLLINVISDYLRFMRDLILKNLRKDSIHYEEASSKWCITVPAIWNDKMKNFMREAAKNAGIVSDQYTNLQFEYEPEVAGIGCMKFSNLKLKIGKIFIVVDVGGGTIDITAYRVGVDTLSQIYKANGGPSGGKYVDRAFLNYILQKCKNAQFTSRQQVFEVLENNEGYPEFIENWERAKCNMEENAERVILSVPKTICDFFKETSQSSIDSIPIFDLKKGRIILKRKDIQAIFKDTVSKAIDHIENAYGSDELKNLKVDYMFFVGGFSGCSILRNEVEQRFGKLSEIIHPETEYRSCILKGALMSSSQSKNPIVRRRVLTHTYGVEVQRKFLDNDDPSKKVGDMCKDAFEIFARSGDSFNINDSIKKTFKVNAGSLNLDVSFYSTTSLNSKYITDQGISKLALLHIHLPVGTTQHEATVEMEFGGTEIRSRVLVGDTSSEWVLLDVNAVAKNDNVYIGEPYIYDICFLMDATSSMEPYIDATKSYIIKLVNSLLDKVKNTKYFKVRIAYVTYRDFNDEIPLKVHDFQEFTSNTSLEEVENFEETIGKTVAEGGDDTAEDMMLGLYAALGLNWKGDKKLIILIADSPCHGLKYNGLTRHEDWHDNCYLQHPERQPERLFQRLIREGIDLSVVNVNDSQMRTMLNTFAQLFNSESRSINIIEINNNKDSERILTIFNEQLTQSIVSRLVVIEEATMNRGAKPSDTYESFESVR